MTKLKSILIGIGLLIVLLLFSSLSTILVHYFADKNLANQSETVEKYGIKGLPYGVELSKEVRLMDEKYIYYDDRIVEIYTNNSLTNKASTHRIQAFMNAIPNTVNKVVSIVPMAITYESNLELYNKSSLEAIREIKNGLNDSIQWLDVDTIYQSKRDEYIYFRTDPRITSLGAYYIANKFLKSKGIEMRSLDEYQEDRRAKVQGIYMYLENANLSTSYEDNVIFYKLEGSKNLQKVTVRVADDQYLTYESPTIALSRRGLDVFVEGSLSDSILYGDGEGNSIIVIGDYTAKVLSPWLTPYYENVIVINAAFYTKSKAEFYQLFDEYSISDIILIESLDNIGDSSMNSKLKLIYE